VAAEVERKRSDEEVRVELVELMLDDEVDHGGNTARNEYRLQRAESSNKDVSEPLLLGVLRPRLRWIFLYWSPAAPTLRNPRNSCT